MSAAPADLIAAFENRAKLLASLDRLRKSSAAQFSRALATLTKLRVPAKAPQPAAPAPLQTKPTSPAVPPRPTLQFPDFFELDMPQNLAHAIDHSAHLE